MTKYQTPEYYKQEIKRLYAKNTMSNESDFIILYEDILQQLKTKDSEIKELYLKHKELEAYCEEQTRKAMLTARNSTDQTGYKGAWNYGKDEAYQDILNKLKELNND